MSSEYQFLSVMTPPVTAGQLSFSVQTTTFASTDTGAPKNTVTAFPDTFNMPVVSTFVVSISSINGTESEIGLATKVFNQLGTSIIQQGLNYAGFLSYAEEVYPATFQVTRSDHCVCVWSQTLFTISISSNTTGCSILIDQAPALVTLQGGLDSGLLINFDYTTDFGATLTNSQIMDSILKSSSALTNRLRNFIIISTYAKEIRGNDTDCVQLAPYPVIDFDQPRIRRKNIVDVFNLPQWGKFAYGIVGHKRNNLKFRFSEYLIDHREPFYSQNLVYISFIAGHNHIPEEIKDAVVEYSMYKLHNRGELKSMKGGSGAFAFIDSIKVLQKLLIPILNYKMRPRD